MPPAVTKRTSPHQNARPAGAAVSGIVLHADAGKSAASSINWMMDPRSQVSYHAIIERDGAITELVDPTRRAWHAGVSVAAGRQGCNDFTVGVCFANRQDGEPFTEAQVASGVAYCVALRQRFPQITLDRVWTHEQVARPEGRKSDPGPLFPLAAFLTRLRKATS
jgi:N-acetyl-anhydromuramyl-L-alanine amidase AmpD